MWRKLTVLLFLLVLAQTASALPHAEILVHIDTNVAINQVEQSPVAAFDNDKQEHLFTLPHLHRANPSLFSADIQTSPNYVLVVEFFKNKLSAALFKHLANPPVMLSWFERLSHNTNSSRLSGWKDGNFLYSSRNLYHS